MDYKWIVAAIVVAILVVGGLAVVWWASQNLWTLGSAALVLIVFGVIVAALWYLTRPQPPQINKMNLKNIRDAAAFGAQRLRESCPGGVWMRGTINSPGGFFLGYPDGYASEDLVAVLGGKKKVVEENGAQYLKREGGIEYNVRLHFVFVKKGGLLSFFSKSTPIAFFDVKDKAKEDVPENWRYSHSPFSGELIIFGNSPVKVNEFLWSSSQADDPFVDEFVTMKGKNITTHEILNEVAQYVKTGIKGNPQHQMELEMRKDLDAAGAMAAVPKREVE